MAEFRIDLKESIRIKKQFTAIIEEFKDLEKRLYAVKDNLSSMSEYKEIVNRLDRKCREVTEERTDVEKLLQTFSACVQCYENAEKKVREQEIDWHLVLDAAGLLPGIGAAFDGANTAWYAAEGDWNNALLSGLAFVPGIGEAVGGGKTAVKAGSKAIGHLDDAVDIARAADKAGGSAKAAGKAGKAGKSVGELGKYVDEAVESGTSTKPNQVHHYATNKSRTYTLQLEEIANRYGLDLGDAWNKDLLPHQGRHPNAYHEYVLDSMKQFDNIAQGNKDIFLKLFDNLKNNVKSNPDMLYKDYWK